MRVLATAVIAAGIGMGVPGVHAAPQLLGIVASSTPFTLECIGRTCSTELATLCLQAERDIPSRHHGYDPLDMNDFVILARDSDGELIEHSIEAAQFRSERGYTATSMTFDAQSLIDLGLKPIAVRIQNAAVLVPHPIPGHPAPLAEAEVVAAEQTLKPMALSVFKTHATEYEAITVVSRLLDATPSTGRIPKGQRDQFWEQTFGETPRETVAPGAKKAADIYGYCQYRVGQGRFFSMRRCLENRLDGMLMDLNTGYWDAVAPGS